MCGLSATRVGLSERLRRRRAWLRQRRQTPVPRSAHPTTCTDGAVGRHDRLGFFPFPKNGVIKDYRRMGASRTGVADRVNKANL